jgi:hypothetical protein
MTQVDKQKNLESLYNPNDQALHRRYRYLQQHPQELYPDRVTYLFAPGSRSLRPLVPVTLSNAAWFALDLWRRAVTGRIGHPPRGTR